MTTTTETLAQDIHDRLEAMRADQVSRAQFDDLFQESLKSDSGLATMREAILACLPDLQQDPEFKRKFRFNADPEPALAGTKFARWGLNASDIEWLHDVVSGSVGRAKRGGGVYGGPSEELENAFRAVSEAVYLSEEEIKRIDRTAVDELYPRVPKNPKLTRYNMQQREQHYRAMDTLESGYGQQLVGAQYIGDMWDVARPESVVDSLISTFEMRAPVAYLPVPAGLPRMKLVSETVSSSPTAFPTSKTPSNRVSVTASKFALRQLWSGELEEDAIIQFVPFLREQAAMALAHDMDALVLNGDTTTNGTGNINKDDEAPDASDYFLAHDGLRHAGLVDNTANGINVAGVVSVELFRDLRRTMLDVSNTMDWGHPTNREDLVFVCDPETADMVEFLDDVLEWKKYNNQGAILGGEAARIMGHPIISSVDLGKTEADGKQSYDTPSNNVKGQIVAFNRRGAVTGWLRRVRVETDRDISTDQNEIVYTLRRGMGRYTPTGAASGIEWAAVAYNISLP